jgi:phosphatidylglycerol:prolipoprotein diacylglycerol transferase
MQQLQSGQLLGIKTEPVPNESYYYRVIDLGDGVGKEIGLTEGETISINALDAERMRYLVGTPKAELANLEIVGERIGRSVVPVSRLKQRSRGVHPTQIYSSINALVLCLFLWFYWHVRRNDGEVMALMLILYPISRFVLELIRNDEAGQFGTELTISQWVSLITIACGIGLFAYVRMFGKRSAIPEAVTNEVSR